MGTGATTFVATDALTKANVDSRIDDIENFMNGGMIQGDLQSSQWVRPRHIVRPRFFGAPAPRVIGTTFDLHYRGEIGFDRTERSAHHGLDGLDDWVPVRDLGASFKVRGSTTFSVMVTMYAWTSGGDLEEPLTAPATVAYWEQILAGTFSIFVNGTRVTGCRRKLWVSPVHNVAPKQPAFEGRKQIPLMHQVTLASGTHTVDVRVKPTTPTIASGTSATNLDWKHLWVEARFMGCCGERQ